MIGKSLNECLNNNYPFSKRDKVKEIKLNYNISSNEILIDNFPSLEKIELSFNQISYLSIDEMSSRNIKKINLGSNNLKSLDFINNLNPQKIEEIIVDNNKLEIDIDYLIEIKKRFPFLKNFDFHNDTENSFKAQRNVLNLKEKNTSVLNSKIFKLDNTNLIISNKLLPKAERNKRSVVHSRKILNDKGLALVGSFTIAFLLIIYSIIKLISKKNKIRQEKENR